MKKNITLRTVLMSTVAAAAFAGLTTIAAAQTAQSPAGGGAMSPQGGAQQEHKGGATGSAAGGSTLHQQDSAQPGATPGEKSPGTSTGQSAQEGAKTKSQNSAQGEKGTNEMNAQRGTNEMNSKGAQTEQNTQKKGAERNTQQKGAQTQGNTQLKGAQGERNERGAQTERNERGAQTESGEAGVNATQQNAQGSVHGGATSHGASVRLTQDQRTRITSVIGKSSSARINTANFDVRVGTRIPRDVHVVALPPDVVEIVPQYRGFEYVMIGDRILIIDPATLEIVDVIEA